MENASPKPSPLAELAVIITRCGRQGMTPVIVCGDAMTLRDEFYQSLCEAVRAASGCTVRLDVLPHHRLPGVIAAIFRDFAVSRFAKRLANFATVTTTVALSRSGHPSSEIVVGLAGKKDDLPSYAKAIELAA